jgi:dihydrolipoamide dehydrogenase
MATQKTQTLVIGSGPGGYTAAFRAADLGQEVTLIEYHQNLGGVCLNVGCIPSKALLHLAKVIFETKELSEKGLSFAAPAIDLVKIRQHVENDTINKLTGGLKLLANQRKVTVVHGLAKFQSPTSVSVTLTDNSTQEIEFTNAIIAIGSRSIKLPFVPESKRVMDSTQALLLEDVPQELLVIGGGIIGMEMGTVYCALGSNVTVVELADSLLGAADKDLVAPLMKRMKTKFKDILLNTKVSKVEEKADGLYVSFEGNDAIKEPVRFDKILLSVGRIPNGKDINASAAGVHVDERGFIPVNSSMRTNIPHIYAIGDVVGQPMLAHKAMHEAKVAAEVIAGQKHTFEPKCIPSVAYTDPEVAWVGLTETEAKTKGIKYAKEIFPWAASGRALAEGRSEGFTKLLFDEHERVIGAGIVGVHAGDIISEVALAIEMGCDAQDLALTIHPHPTFSESVGLAAEVYEGTITDLYSPKKK